MHKHNRLFLLSLFFSVLLCLIIVRLFYIQILAADTFFSNNYLHTVRITPDRGSIYDRNNEPLVINRTDYLAFASPKDIKDKDIYIKKIDSILKIGEATLSSRIDMEKVWVPIQAGITEDKKRELASLNLRGIGFEKGQARFYLETSLAAQLLGFVGKDNEGDPTGYFGLEGYYSRDLSGLPGLFKSELDVIGKPIFVGVQDMINGENGRDLKLNLDKVVQRIAKSKLELGMGKYGAREGCIIIADPHTLEIIALTCLPDFDPDEYYKFSQENFTNPTISALYEPGSIFKPLIMAAALNESVITPDEKFNESGAVHEGGYTIKTWDDTYEGVITLTRALEKSSNVAMVHVGKKLGNEKLLTYLSKFGIGENTNIDLQGEISGFLKPKSQWYSIDYATATFGQGITITPIQMIRAFSALINGGYIMEPHVVGEIDSKNGEKKHIAPKIVRRIFSEKTSFQIRSMLQKTVEHAEAKWDRPKGYAIGGKTGTAQIPLAGHYDSSKTIASFIGFAPTDNPKFVALVIYKEPKSSPWGSETAAPTFFEMVKELLVYYNIEPAN